MHACSVSDQKNCDCPFISMSKASQVFFFSLSLHLMIKLYSIFTKTPKNRTPFAFLAVEIGVLLISFNLLESKWKRILREKFWWNTKILSLSSFALPNFSQFLKSQWPFHESFPSNSTFNDNTDNVLAIQLTCKSMQANVNSRSVFDHFKMKNFIWKYVSILIPG